MFMFHCAYSILVLSPLSFSSARRRKFFLCRGAWKNKTLVNLFRSMRCQKERLIGTDVLSKDCIPSSQEWSESMAKGLKAIRGLEQTTDGTERLVTAPNAENTALMIAEFMRPLPSQTSSGFRKTMQLFPSGGKQHPRKLRNKVVPGPGSEKGRKVQGSGSRRQFRRA
jgi:hypothetical protein